MFKIYKPHQQTLEERKAMLTENLSNFKDSSELDLAIEGRFTNLRIWVGNSECIAKGGGEKLIYMRIDKANDYSVTFCSENIRLNKEHEAMLKLSKFGFTSPISCLDEILEITKDMPNRACIEW